MLPVKLGVRDQLRYGRGIGEVSWINSEGKGLSTQRMLEHSKIEPDGTFRPCDKFLEPKIAFSD